MCTVSWIRENNNYQVFFNRDELRVRGKEISPHIQSIKGVQVLAPLDTDVQGTWCGVNDLGITLCLLNLYPKTFKIEARDYYSRGLLLKHLLSLGSIKVIEEYLVIKHLKDSKPFRILYFDLDGTMVLWCWDGSHLSKIMDDYVQCPLTSSSYEEDAIIKLRKEYFERMLHTEKGITEDFLISYHRSQYPYPSAQSVCMSRKDAKTFSFSRVQVSRTDIKYIYDSNPFEYNLDKHLVTTMKIKQ